MPNNKPQGVAYSDPEFESLSLNGAAVTSTAAELNRLAGVVAGVVAAGKALVVDASKRLNEIIIGTAGTPVTQLRIYAAALNPASVAANTTVEQTFAVDGLATTDKVFISKPAAQAGLGIVGTRVHAAGILAITFANVTGLAIVPTAGEVYQITTIRS